MKTIQEFIEENGITSKAVRLEERMDGNESDWDKNARHFQVTLYRGGHNTGKGPEVARMSVPFSQGSAHVKNPTASDVLDCLAMDASGEQSDFESWAADYGYDTDSRKAEATFKAVQTQTIRLQKFLGRALYIELLGLERL